MTMQEKRLIVRHSRNNYEAPCNVLIKKHRFVDIAFVENDKSIKSKRLILKALIQDTLSLFKHLPHLRRADIIFAVGYQAVPLIVLQKIGVLQCRRLIWFGLFVHSPRWFFLFRIFFVLFSSRQVRYIVFSRGERNLYHIKFAIPLGQIVHVPYGSWETTNTIQPATSESPIEGIYYFAGGASNRDYASLIEVFRQRNEKLVIVGSTVKNSDIVNLKLPPNILIYTDVTSDQFDLFIRNAKACILLIKHNTGASGQSVLLRYLKQSKAVIASNTDVIRDYVEHNISGVLVDHPLQELPQILDTFALRPEDVAKFGSAAHEHFLATFSREALEESLDSAIFE